MTRIWNSPRLKWIVLIAYCLLDTCVKLVSQVEQWERANRVWPGSRGGLPSLLGSRSRSMLLQLGPFPFGPVALLVFFPMAYLFYRDWQRRKRWLPGFAANANTTSLATRRGCARNAGRRSIRAMKIAQPTRNRRNDPAGM